MPLGLSMQDTFPVCRGLEHEDPLEFSTFFLFSRGDVSIWIISKGETTMWGWWGPIKTRLGTGTL